MRAVKLESDHDNHGESLFRSWGIDSDARSLTEALQAYLEHVDVRSKTTGEGMIQARWAHLGHAKTPRLPWTTIDREVAFGNQEALLERADVDVGPARRAVLAIAKSRPPNWSEPRKTAGRLDQLAVDGEGNLVLVEIKDAASNAGVFYAPLQLLKYVYVWNDALRRLAVWQQLQALIDARHDVGLSPDFPKLTGGVRAAVCFGSFREKASAEVKRRFYEVLGVVNAHLPSGVLPIEAWEFEKDREPTWV